MTCASRPDGCQKKRMCTATASGVLGAETHAARNVDTKRRCNGCRRRSTSRLPVGSSVKGALGPSTGVWTMPTVAAGPGTAPWAGGAPARRGRHCPGCRTLAGFGLPLFPTPDVCLFGKSGVSLSDPANSFLVVDRVPNTTAGCRLDLAVVQFLAADHHFPEAPAQLVLPVSSSPRVAGHCHSGPVGRFKSLAQK